MNVVDFAESLSICVTVYLFFYVQSLQFKLAPTPQLPVHPNDVFPSSSITNLTEFLFLLQKQNCTSHRCPLTTNSTLIGQFLATSSYAPLPHALPSTDMGYVDGLLRVGDEVDSSPIDFVAHVYIMPILLLLGFINQCLNIVTLNSLASAGYLYLKASAIGDVVSILALIPFCIRQGKAHNQHSYLTMFFHAHIELPLINAFITASALCLVGMTIDRYLCIRAPITFYTPDCKKRIRTSIICLYILACFLFIPSAWQKVLIPHWDSQNKNVFWTIHRNKELVSSVPFKIYLMVRELIGRIGPIVVLTVLNIGMIRSLRRIKIRYNSRRLNSSSNPRVREMDRTRISVLLLITSATFVICTLPASLLSLFVDSVNGVEIQMFRAFANCLQVSHYLHNFYLYTICSCEYRHAFLKLIGCYKPRRLPYSTGESPTIRFSTTVLGRVCSLRFDRLSKYAGRKKIPTASAAI